jgi:YHS domain-containing protein
VHGIFQAFGAIPTERPEAVVPDRFQWNYTTYLNIVFLVVFAGLWWLARTRRAGAEDADGMFATDPMCGMQVDKQTAPAHLSHDGVDVWFCSDGCRERYASRHGLGVGPAR